MKKKNITRVEPEAQYGSRIAGEILHQHQENSNTDLCMDVKTFLRNDRRTQIGKMYTGVLTRDGENHYSFIETLPSTAGKRNPHLFVGEYITITLQDDGTLRPNFKPMRIGVGWSVDGYANGVAYELRKALSGLVEKCEC